MSNIRVGAASKGVWDVELGISETILRASRLQEMRAWYVNALQRPPSFKYEPRKNTEPGELGGHASEIVVAGGFGYERRVHAVTRA